MPAVYGPGEAQSPKADIKGQASAHDFSCSQSLMLYYEPNLAHSAIGPHDHIPIRHRVIHSKTTRKEEKGIVVVCLQRLSLDRRLGGGRVGFVGDGYGG